MSQHHDWVMREIEMTVRFVAETIFKTDTVQYEILDGANLSKTDLLHRQIVQLMDDRRLWQAEHTLLQNMDKDSLDNLLLAVEFYQSLNRMTDADLAARDFTREDVMDGLSAVLAQFNIVFPGL